MGGYLFLEEKGCGVGDPPCTNKLLFFIGAYFDSKQHLLRSQMLTIRKNVEKWSGKASFCYLLFGITFKIFSDSYKLPWSRGLLSAFGSQLTFLPL